MTQKGKETLAFENGGFNQPRVVVDFGEYKKKKAEQAEGEKLEALRDDIKTVQKETQKRYAEKRKDSFLFIGPEICEVDPDKLVEADLELYGQFKDFKRDKLSSNEFFSSLSKYRFKLAEYQSFVRDTKPNCDFSKDSRTQFLGWLQNKWIGEQTRRMKIEKEKKTGGVA
ncbi:hypothetical protein KKA27_01625 [Patescibacteria group bacterium]|nr:hypothetical protein [Patescibacteria group bacterium]MBU2633431.1 hypothetical protein [Patescibacteria group bacterium]